MTMSREEGRRKKFCLESIKIQSDLFLRVCTRNDGITEEKKSLIEKVKWQHRL